MNCYICDQTSHPITMRYGLSAAIGICHECGIGVCAQHSHRPSDAGSLLLCKACATQRGTLPAPHALPSPQEREASLGCHRCRFLLPATQLVSLGDSPH